MEVLSMTEALEWILPVVSAAFTESLPFISTFAAFFGHGVSLLMPGARRGTYLGPARELLAARKDAEAVVSLEFARRRGGRRVRASFPADVLSFDRALLEKPLSLQKVEELARQSKRAADELRAARRSMERIEKRLGALLPAEEME